MHQPSETPHRTAAILSIGDELTLGQTLDTNGRWFAQQLVDRGILPIEHVTVPDDLDANVAALRRLAASVDVIISSGGLGPTKDDLTRDALCQAMGDTLVEDPAMLAMVEKWYTSRGRVMTAPNRAQALRPSRGVALPNFAGTAPGLAGTIESSAGSGRRCDVFCLPGPPRELFPMFEREVVPRLRVGGGRSVVTRVLHCFGIAESDLAARLGELMDRDAPARGGAMVGTTASGGVVSVRVRVDGQMPLERAEALADEVARQARQRAGGYVFGTGTQTLAMVVVDTLVKAGQVLTTVESCTGGLLGQVVTDVPGSSRAFAGGLVTYSNELKARLAGVDPALIERHGAVSEQVARAMALGGRARLGAGHAAWCIAITGIAGPDGGSAEKPVGTVFIALAGPGHDAGLVRRFAMVGERANVREWAVKSALSMLLQAMAGERRVLLREVEVQA